jgi:hypothetical protein
MADRTKISLHRMGQQGAAETSQPAMNATGERSVLAEFADAAQSAAGSLVEEQKRQIADRVSGIAEALEGAAYSLDQSKNHAVGRYVHEAGQQIRSFSRTLQEGRWNELIADIDDFARRQPTWFVLGAVAAGFLVGRFLWTATNAPSHRADASREALRRETTREVTAAISNAPGVHEQTDYAAGSAIGSPA